MSAHETKLTLAELCQLLDVRPAWINDAAGRLTLPLKEKGDGPYSQDDYYLLRNIKILCMANIDWGMIKEFYDKEKIVHEEIIRYLEKLNAKFNDGEITLREAEIFIYFILAEPLKVPFRIDLNYETDRFKPQLTIYDDLEYLFESTGFYTLKSKIDDKIARLKGDLGKFMSMNYYRPVEMTGN